MGRRTFKGMEKVARSLGLVFDGYTSKGHLRWRHPQTGRFTITASTATSWRTYKNAMRDMRKLAEENVNGSDV